MMILSIFLTTINSFADDTISNGTTKSSNNSAVHLSKGASAPFEGILLSLPNAQNTKQHLIDLEQTNESLNKSITLYQANETLYKANNTALMTQNQTLSKDAYELQTNNFWKSTIYFLAGVAFTGLMYLGVKKTQ